jgi:nitrogen regulatory protein PII
MAFKCIVVMLKPDLTDKVIEAAKKVGATGATIIPASGTGIHEAKTFFGLSLDVRTEVLLFLVHEQAVEPVLAAVEKAGRFRDPGTGIAFAVPVDNTCGLESQFSREGN